jgi:hypothetical protein
VVRVAEFAGGEGTLAALGWAHGHVDIFEQLARSDTAHTVGRFDEVVSFLTAMLAAEGIDEEKRFGELFGSDQKARAIYQPVVCYFHDARHPWGEGKPIADLRFTIADFHVTRMPTK